MITISDSLASAAFAESRSPAIQVTLENHGIDEPTLLVSDTSLPYQLRRFQQGSGFYIVTGRSGTTIYYKRMTTIENVADWTAGWASLANTSTSGALCHDMCIIGSRVIVAYEKTGGVIYARESTDGGQSWGAEYEVVDLTGYGEDGAYYVSIADDLTIFVAAVQLDYWPGTSIDINKFTVYKIYRNDTASPWNGLAVWDVGGYLVGESSAAPSENRNIFARNIFGEKYRVTGPMKKGHTNLSDSIFDWTHFIDCEYDNWGVVISAFGGYSLDSTHYFWSSNGLSRQFNGYYFTFTAEKYPPGYDAHGAYGFTSIIERYHIARTTDLHGYNMIPWPDPVTPGSVDFLPFLCGVGLSESGNYICIPSSYWTSNGIVYMLPVSSWFGEGLSSEDITPYVIENISINKQISKASTASMQVSNKTTHFSGSDILLAHALIRIRAGYDTAAGTEMVERFAGYVTSYQKNIGADKTISFNMMDRLAPATSRQERLPHILKGQNTFYTNFTNVLDIDMFATQVGAFEVAPAGYHLRTAIAGYNVTYAGFDPTDAVLIESVIYFSSANPSTQIGVVISGTTWTAPYDTEKSYHKLFYWNGSTQKFTFGDIVTSGDYVQQRLFEQGDSTHALSAATNYWIRARLKHGMLDGWYSTDGVSWTEVLTDVEVGGSALGGTTFLNVDPFGYVGLYAYMATGQTAVFDNVTISSMYPPVSGSDAMKHLAAVAGLDYSDTMAIDDDFPGTSFSSRWDTPGTDGTWSVSGGFAEGYKSGADPALLACDVTANDIIVNATVRVYSGMGDTGIFARGYYSGADVDSCYAFVVNIDNATIKRKVNGVWGDLSYVPHIYSFEYARLTLVVRGLFIAGYINDELVVVAKGSYLTEGYCGLYSDSSITWPSQISEFSIDSFYTPLDVVTIRPGDKVASVMDQIVAMYDDGYYYVNNNGELVWGVLDADSVDIDARSRMITMGRSKDHNEISTFSRVVGEDSYNEAVDVNWGRALSGHRYVAMEDKYISTKEACGEEAEKLLDESQKISTASITIPGHPGLELTDVIKISDDPSEEGTDHVVMGFSEVVGDAYEITISELRSMEPEIVPFWAQVD